MQKNLPFFGSYVKNSLLLKHNPEAYLYRGLAFSKLGLYDVAISYYTKAIELNPDYAAAYYNRGTAYARQENYDQADSDYTQAIELNPKYAEAANNRSETDAKQFDAKWNLLFDELKKITDAIQTLHNNNQNLTTKVDQIAESIRQQSDTVSDELKKITDEIRTLHNNNQYLNTKVDQIAESIDQQSDTVSDELKKIEEEIKKIDKTLNKPHWLVRWIKMPFNTSKISTFIRDRIRKILVKIGRRILVKIFVATGGLIAFSVLTDYLFSLF